MFIPCRVARGRIYRRVARGRIYRRVARGRIYRRVARGRINRRVARDRIYREVVGGHTSRLKVSYVIQKIRWPIGAIEVANYCIVCSKPDACIGLSERRAER